MRIYNGQTPTPETISRGLPRYRTEASALDRAGLMQGGYHQCAPDFMLGRRAHPWHWLAYTVSGAGEFYTEYQSATQSGIMKPGQLWVFPQHVAYTVKPQRKNWDFYWWSLSPDQYRFDNYAQALELQDCFPHFLNALSGILNEQSLLIGEREETLRSYSQLISTFCRRQFQAYDSGQRDRSSAHLRSIWQAITDDPGHDWDLKQLAALAHLSVSQLVRRMKQEYQCTPMQLLMRLRIRAAERLLANGDLGLDTIAARVGYCSGFALSKAFKRETGISPKHYREMMWS